ncbi:MAG: helix-turn-helix domain-containing protein [Polyangiaceae bacterium]|nr:helix-turn-helix domain-containing protein [Polyangiaceae bacterium]
MRVGSPIPPGAQGTNTLALLAAVGLNVRQRRLDLAMTVRELAQRSGLSERFLVALEGGQANVSVVRLAEVADALGVPLVQLLPTPRDTYRVPQNPPTLPLPLALVGLRGAGKSTVGARAAARLGVPFIELDERIAARAGMSPGEIFDVHGVDFYRRVEREELERVLAEEPACVLATAGSLVTQSATFERLLAAARVVWLKATPQDHFSRVLAQGDTRPMRDREDAMQELEAILRARRALHERAHHIVDTSALGLSRAVSSVVRLARAR